MPSGVYLRTEKHKHSEATKAYLREINTGSKNPAFGKPTTDKQKAAARLAMQGNTFRKGSKAWNKGTNLGGMSNKKHSEETKRKMSETHSNIEKPWLKSDEEHHAWKGGVSRDKTHVSFVKNKRNRLKKFCSGKHTEGEWEALKSFHEYICLSCGRKEPDIKLTKDHVIPIALQGSDDISNIQPLCISCNVKKASDIIDFRELST